MFGFEIVVVLAFLMVYVKAAEMERSSPLLLGGVSLAVSLVTFYALGWGLFAGILAQGMIYVGMTVRNMLRTPPPV